MGRKNPKLVYGIFGFLRYNIDIKSLGLKIALRNKMSHIKSKISSLKVTHRFIQHYFFGKTNSAGFTIMELMVVLTISAFLFTAIIVNINGQRAPRDLKIAQNELVSNIRKAQSYTLSSRNLPSGQSVQYYVIKFDLLKKKQYTIEAIFNVGSSPQMQIVETIKLPTNVKISGIRITQRPMAPGTQNVVSEEDTGDSGTCALASFVAPYGKVIFNVVNSHYPPEGASYPYTLQPDDQYQQLVNFQNNVQCLNLMAPPPTSCTASTDSIMTITLINTAKPSLQKHVIINGITGSVSFD